MPKPKPDESGLEWVLREGSRALEALLREVELKGLKFAHNLSDEGGSGGGCYNCWEHGMNENCITQQRIAELEKASKEREDDVLS